MRPAPAQVDANRARLAGLHGVELVGRRPGALACGLHRPAPRCSSTAGTGVVEVDGVRHTAEHVVVGNGRGPVRASDPGTASARRRLGHREATSMTACCAACSCWAAGPQASRWRRSYGRFGGEAALIEGAEHILPAQAAPLGEALGEALRRDGIELALWTHATAAARDGDEYVLELDGDTEQRGDRLLACTGRRPRAEGIASKRSASRPTPTGSRLTSTWRRRAPLGDRRRHRASGCSPTSASTRPTWSQRTSPGIHDRRTTKPFPESPTRIPRPRRWASSKRLQRHRTRVRSAEDRHGNNMPRRIQRVQGRRSVMASD